MNGKKLSPQMALALNQIVSGNGTAVAGGGGSWYAGSGGAWCATTQTIYALTRRGLLRCVDPPAEAILPPYWRRTREITAAGRRAAEEKS